MVCAQVRGLPTLFFISPDPNKDAIRTEGLIPLQMMRDIINNEMWRREALNCHRNPWFLLLVLVYLIQINCLLLVLYVIYFIFVVWFCRDLFALNEIPWIARMYFFIVCASFLLCCMVPLIVFYYSFSINNFSQRNCSWLWLVMIFFGQTWKALPIIGSLNFSIKQFSLYQFYSFFFFKKNSQSRLFTQIVLFYK